MGNCHTNRGGNDGLQVSLNLYTMNPFETYASLREGHRMMGGADGFHSLPCPQPHLPNARKCEAAGGQLTQHLLQSRMLLILLMRHASVVYFGYGELQLPGWVPQPKTRTVAAAAATWLLVLLSIRAPIPAHPLSMDASHAGMPVNIFYIWRF